MKIGIENGEYINTSEKEEGANVVANNDFSSIHYIQPTDWIINTVDDGFPSCPLIQKVNDGVTGDGVLIQNGAIQKCGIGMGGATVALTNYKASISAKGSNGDEQIGIAMLNSDFSMVYNFVTLSWEAMQGFNNDAYFDKHTITDEYVEYSTPDVPAYDGTTISFNVVLGANDAIRFDDAKMVESGQTTNLFTNADFELWDSNIFADGWYRKISMDGDSVEVDTSEQYNSHNTLKFISNDSNGSYASLVVNVDASTLYTLYTTAKQTLALNNISISLFNNRIDIASKIYNFTTSSWDTYDPTAADEPDSDHKTNIGLTSDYVTNNLPINIPVGYTKLGVLFTHEADNSGVIYLGEVSLKQSSSAFNGDSHKYSIEKDDLNANDTIFNYIVKDNGADYSAFKLKGNLSFDTEEIYFNYSNKPMKIGDPIENTGQEAVNVNGLKMNASALVDKALDIDFTSSNAVEMFVVPEGKTFIPMDVVLYTTESDAPVGDSNVTIGSNSPDYSDIIYNNFKPHTSSNCVARGPRIDITENVFSAGTAIYLKVATPDSGTTLKGNAYLFGYFI